MEYSGARFKSQSAIESRSLAHGSNWKSRFRARQVADPAAVVKSEAPLTIGAVEELLKGMLDTQRAENAETVAALEEKIAKLEAPARSRVVTNGATGKPVGRDGEAVTGGSTSDAAELRKMSDDAPDALSKKLIDDKRMALAVEMLRSKMTPTA